MANLNPNNPSHVFTWFSLFRLKQTRKNLDDAGTIKMSDLLFYNPASSQDSLKMDATLIAKKIDKIFTDNCAKLEDDITRNTAFSEMVTTLIDKDKTISDLAEVNDKNYLFFNETKEL